MSGSNKMAQDRGGQNSEKEISRKSFNPQKMGNQPDKMSQILYELSKQHTERNKDETQSNDVSRVYPSKFGDTNSVKTTSSWKKQPQAQEASFRRIWLSREPLQRTIQHPKHQAHRNIEERLLFSYEIRSINK